MVELKIIEQLGTTGKGTSYILSNDKDAKDDIMKP